MVARTVLETLRQVTDAPEDVEAVFAVVSRLAQDVGKLFYYFFVSRSASAKVFFWGGVQEVISLVILGAQIVE